MSVYNIVWADDEIDDFLDDDYKSDLLEIGFKIIGTAHNGEELESQLKKHQKIVDAIIVDANFSETSNTVESERDVSGLECARYLYRYIVNYSIPFFLYSGRTEELLNDVQSKERPNLLRDFVRHENWFSKTMGERDEMLEAIKKAVNKRNSTGFIIRNRYQYELNAAILIDGAYDLLFDFFTRESENTLNEMVEPFVRERRIIEKLFGSCENWKLIPPISDDTNGTADYFLYNSYSPKQKDGSRIKLYKMSRETIMPKPLAQSLVYIVDITQDGAHSKGKLKLKVDRYYEQTKDTLLLRSVTYILIDVIKWFALTLHSHQDKDANEAFLWEKCN